MQLQADSSVFVSQGLTSDVQNMHGMVSHAQLMAWAGAYTCLVFDSEAGTHIVFWTLAVTCVSRLCTGQHC